MRSDKTSQDRSKTELVVTYLIVLAVSKPTKGSQGQLRPLRSYVCNRMARIIVALGT